MPDFALTLRKEAVAMKAAAKCTKWLKFPQRRRANFKPRVGFLLMMNGGLKIAQYGFFFIFAAESSVEVELWLLPQAAGIKDGIKLIRVGW